MQKRRPLAEVTSVELMFRGPFGCMWVAVAILAIGMNVFTVFPEAFASRRFVALQMGVVSAGRMQIGCTDLDAGRSLGRLSRLLLVRNGAGLDFVQQVPSHCQSLYKVEALSDFFTERAFVDGIGRVHS